MQPDNGHHAKVEKIPPDHIPDLYDPKQAQTLAPHELKFAEKQESKSVDSVNMIAMPGNVLCQEFMALFDDNCDFKEICIQKQHLLLNSKLTWTSSIRDNMGSCHATWLLCHSFNRVGIVRFTDCQACAW